MPSPTERSAIASIAAHESWAKTDDRPARTQAARDAMWRRFLEQAGGDPVRAENLRQAHYKRLALKSAQARRLRAEADQAAAELSELDLDETGAER